MAGPRHGAGGADLAAQLFPGGIFVKLMGELVGQPDQDAEDKESAGGQDENGDGGEKPPLRPAENSPVAEELPDKAHGHQRAGEAGPHPQSVQGGQPHAVAGGKGLRPAEDDAIDHDQGQINPQRLVDGGQVRLHQQLDDGGKARDDDDVGGQPHLIGDHAAQEGNDDVRADQHEGGGGPHPQSIHGRGSHSQSGAGAEDQAEDRVFPDQALGKFIDIPVHVPLSPFVCQAVSSFCTAVTWSK